MNFNDDLFSGNLDSKMDFLNDKKAVSADGIYRVDLTKVKDKKKGYRSVVRFLPNFTKNNEVKQSAIEKIAHYVDIKNVKELSGWFDSAKNFNEKCALTDLYYNMINSKNAILVEKAKCLKYSKKYYSYVLVIEDEQQPELVGKIMIFQYGKTIKDKILSEKNGEISGVSCNVFDLAAGKDFVLLVKEIQTGDETYPDYKMSMFKQDTTSLPVFNEESKTFKNIPLQDGRIPDKFKPIIVEFLQKRDYELEDFEPKRLDEEQQAKITEISNYLLGKSSASYNKPSAPSSDDFDLGTSDLLSTSTTTSASTDEDDFFSDF